MCLCNASGKQQLHRYRVAQPKGGQFTFLGTILLPRGSRNSSQEAFGQASTCLLIASQYEFLYRCMYRHSNLARFFSPDAVKTGHCHL
eukprot:COSAG02_NODE_7848_length_2820_cov_3.458287_2_plen_88_part_00